MERGHGRDAAASSTAALLGPTHCQAEATVAGLWFAAHGRTAWLGFACDRHAEQLIAARALLPRDCDVLNRHRHQRRTLMAGKRWAGERRKARSPAVLPPKWSSSGRRHGWSDTSAWSDDLRERTGVHPCSEQRTGPAGRRQRPGPWTD